MRTITILLAGVLLSGCGATLDANRIKPVGPWVAETFETSQSKGTAE